MVNISHRILYQQFDASASMDAANVVAMSSTMWTLTTRTILYVSIRLAVVDS
jgi:hypothetical protein